MTHYQKSFVIMVMLALMGISTAKGTSAYPGIIDYRQPDGAIIRLRMMGDEYFHWAESEDGYTLLSDAEGFMTLAMPDKEGRLMASAYRMQPVGMREEKLQKAMKEVGRNATFPQKQLKEEVERAPGMRKMHMGVVRNNQPVVGTRHFLVILMQTPDVPFQRSQTEFQRLMNEVNYHEGGNTGSVHDYYTENSFGQLDLQCDVTPVYTAAHPMAYYGNNNNGNPYALAAEALAAAAGSYDMSRYDADGDGYLDGVHIIFSGHGEEAGGGANCIWSHQATTSGSFGSAGGKKMNAYSCSPELRGASGNGMTYIGVICHEIGHVLGTMDFYDTNYSTGGQYPGTGQWDLMASGNWNGNGATPAHFNPYSKIYDFQWSTVQDGNVASMKTLHAKTKGDFVRIDTHTEGEYFLLECRTKTGFDASLPGQGLMVYRASGNLSRWSSNTMNASHRQQFYPLCANAQEAIPTSTSSTYGSVNDPSAPFPGTLGRTQLTDATIPSMKDWEGNNTSLPITDITYTAGSVSFCLAGGDGLAYNLRCETLKPTSLGLAWKNDAKALVLLAYNTEDVFGSPGSADWQSGQTMSGGGTILYKGNGTSHTLTNTEAGTYYYFRLYTRATDGSWKGERTLIVKTPTSIVTSYPYTEDFSTGTLDAGWSQEYVSGSNDWVVDKRFNLSDYSLNFDWSSDQGQRQTTRAVMPVFNFKGHSTACLEFDYRNMLISLNVVYRTSSDEKWKQLCSLDNHYTSGDMTLQQAINTQTHATIALPNLSETYQLAFVADFSWRGNSKSSVEIGTIDNIKVSVDYDAMVTAMAPTAVSNTWADVQVQCLEGTASLTSYGAEWSQNQSTWHRVPATAKEVSTVRLTSLPTNTTIYYRAYGVKSGGNTLYSAIRSFKTLVFSTGSGTEADPFVLSSQSDWSQLVATTDTKGLYFALGCSFTYTPSKKNLFEGCLDGRGYTLSTETNSGKALFEEMSKTATVKNLKMRCTTFQTGSNWSSLIAVLNYGRIENCDINVSNLKLTGNQNFGGASVKNYGIITGCHAYVHLPLTNVYNYGQSGSFANMASVGGLCWYNYNIIDHCSFDGDLHSNNNSKLGGISAINYYESDQRRGIITNCINRGTLEIATISSKAWSISVGGIAGANYGDIRHCVNEGTIIGDGSSSDATFGGIIGSSSKQSTLMCCLNRGTIQYASSMTGYGGGILGYSDRIETAYCISTGTFLPSGASSSYVHAIAGRRSNDNIHDCYYSGSTTDSNGTSVTSWTTAVTALNDKAGVPFVKVVDGQPVLLWESGVEIPYLAVHPITDITATNIGGLFTTSASLKSCGLLYKEVDAEVWNRLEFPSEEMRHSFQLEGLSPITQYQIKAFAVDSEGHTYYTNIVTIMTDFATSGRADDPYLISSVKEFRSFARLTQQGKSMDACLVRLTADLDMRASEGEVWTDFIIGFKGEFDGGGHYIYNLKSVSVDYHYGEGLFAGEGTGYIHDLHIYDAEMSCTRDPNDVFYVGTIAGLCDRIERCSFVGKMTFRYTGNNWNSLCSAGGVVGRATSYARDCYALIQLDSNWTWGFGGIIGYGTAYDSYAACLSSQTPSTKFEGIAGNSNKNAQASNCYYLPAVMKSSPNNGTAMSLVEMKDGTLLASLGTDVWAADIHGMLLDGGFPVLKSQQPLPETEENPDDPDDPNEPIDPDDPVDPIDPDGSDTDLSAYPNVLYLEGTEATVGCDVTLSLKMNNTIAATGFQCDIVLPEGMEVAKDDDFYRIDLSTERTTAQKMNYFDSALQPDGSVRVLCNSTKNYTFAGNAGEVAIVTLHISSQLKDGDYPLILKNIILSDASAKTYKVSYVKTTLTLSSYTLGDANNDGGIDVGDFTAIAGFIMGTPPASFIEKAADVNSDKEINVGDLTAVATLILYGSLTVPTMDNRATSDMPMTVRVDNPSVLAGETFTIDVDVDGLFPFSGYQFDVLLPEGLSVMQIDDEPCVWLSTERTTLQKTDFFTCDSRADGTLRLLSASTKGCLFTGCEGCVAHITLVADKDLTAGDYEVCIEQIVLASNTSTLTLEGTSFLVHVSDPTDINMLKNAQEETVYDLSGRKWTGHDTLNRLNKGIYIINGQKVIK